MSRPFIPHVKVCPYCGLSGFVKFDHKKEGFHPLSRFYCLHCHRGFWKAKDEVQLTTGQQGQRVSRQSYHSNRKYTERKSGRGGKRRG